MNFRNRFTLPLFGALLLATLVSAATAAQRGQLVFDPSRVARITLTVAEADFWTLTHPSPGGEPVYVPCSFDFDGTTLHNVAVRVKGNSSFYTASQGRYPFKLDFNRHVQGQKFNGLKKLNLHTAPQFDPSRLAEFLSYGAFHEFGMPAPRTGWAEVTINGRDLGLYTTVEQVDDDFIKDSFQFTQGDLYKPDRPAGDLKWRGTNILLYENLGHELQPGTDHSSFLNFVEVLNSDSISNLHRVLDIRHTLTHFAGNVALGNQDEYTVWNYYLYESQPGKFSVLPWDMNFSQYWAGHIYPPGTGSPTARSWPHTPLVHQLLTDPVYLAAYHSLLYSFLAGPGSKAALHARIDAAALVLTNRLDASRITVLRSNIDRRVDALLLNLARAFTNTAHPRLVINEVMAANTSAHADGNGDYDDWIELHNPLSTPIDIGGMFLSDDPARPRKWRIPDGQIIPSHGFLVIWADEDPGLLHANFKLAAAGETVCLFDTELRGNSLIDQLSFTNLPPNVSFGRVRDGGSFCVLFATGTPGAANATRDLDADGLPDAWETALGLDPTIAEEDHDPDGDGVPNHFEFQHGSDPQDAASFPGLRAERTSPSELRLRWGIHLRQPQVIEQTLGLENPVWVPIAALQGTNAFEPSIPAAETRFYRLRPLHP